MHRRNSLSDPCPGVLPTPASSPVRLDKLPTLSPTSSPDADSSQVLVDELAAMPSRIFIDDLHTPPTRIHVVATSLISSSCRLSAPGCRALSLSTSRRHELRRRASPIRPHRWSRSSHEVPAEERMH